MKLLNRTYIWSGALLMIAAVGITSCATTGMQRSQDTQTTMETMDKDIKNVSLQLDATGESLNELMRPSQTDKSSAFSSYKNNVEKMESMEKKFAKHAKEMKEKGINYFKEWEKEGTKYKNPQIQQLSDERRATLGKIYDKIAENSIGVNEAFKTYLSDIQEIETFLSNDLTTKGIAAIGPTSKKVVGDGNNLNYAIQELQTAIQNARAEMVQSGTN